MPFYLQSLFWSKTNSLVHRYTKANHDFITLEDTLLGYVADGMSWCGSSSDPGNKNFLIYGRKGYTCFCLSLHWAGTIIPKDLKYTEFKQIGPRILSSESTQNDKQFCGLSFFFHCRAWPEGPFGAAPQQPQATHARPIQMGTAGWQPKAITGLHQKWGSPAQKVTPLCQTFPSEWSQKCRVFPGQYHSIH